MKKELSQLIKILVCVFLMHNVNAQTTNSTTGSTKATATLSASCRISALALSFGPLMLPLTSQQSSSSINVLCNREAAYNIGLAYGGIYGRGTGSGYLYAINSVSNSNGTYNYLLTVYQDSTRSKVITPGTSYSIYAGSAAGFNSYISNSYSCNYNGSAYSCIGSASYAYGIMSGAAKGDSVAYSISVPNDSSKVWNAGQNSYSGTGSGEEQSIPVSGKIIPGNSSSAYPAPDMYLDTVTATITY